MRPVPLLTGPVRDGFSQYLPPVGDRRFWITQALVLAVFASHAVVHAEVRGVPCPLVAIAYALPVLYAALEFGFSGSVATTALVVILTLPYLIDDVLIGDSADFAGHLVEVAILALVAPVVGSAVEAHKLARRAHAAAESRYRALFQTSGVPALVLDDSGHIQEANPAAADVLRGPLEGRALEDVIGAETTKELLAGDRPGLLQISPELELRPVVSRSAGGEGERLTQVVFQDVTEEASGHRRARAWGLAALSAQEEERRRIAQELHDDALQLVVELRRRIERAANALPGAREELVAARGLADQVIDELRIVAVRLRPPDLDDLGLIACLERLVVEAGRRGVTVDFSIEGEQAPLPPAVALAFYRVGQEALTNAEHHARTGHIELRFAFEPGTLQLVVTDDGSGFDLERAEAAATREAHLGIVGMRERMHLVGGNLELRSSPGQGTTVVATMPRRKAEATPAER